MVSLSADRLHLRLLKPSVKPILLLAILSRLFVWILAFLSSYLLDDYDSAADVLFQANSLLQKLFNLTFRAFLRWDAFYFLHLAEEGYVYEQEHAFFPVLPLVIRFFGNYVLWPLEWLLLKKQVLLLAGILVSNFSFVCATGMIYKLTLSISNDHKFSLITALFYILTPSNIFMSSLYAESLFAVLSFMGMRWVMQGNFWKAALVWSVASGVRSNGITYIGFFVFELLKSHAGGCKHLIKKILSTVLYSFVTLLGFIIFEIFGYYKYCHLHSPKRPWCDSYVPLNYSFIQKHYWSCGFLSYYEVKQIPNFLLASPMIALSLCGIYTYSNFDWQRILSLGLQRTKPLVKDENQPTVAKGKTVTSPYFNSKILPFIYLWAVLLFYAITSMHVQ
ncbi:7982_t:CDS:2 [Paraglomus occultum]|uniref:GPI mannosyltransferase 2 n=1 Tax=Paraglomus occultum TaxID=144539 RepID=A0A9N9DBF6_9GLOM|nr:7982_t:CDS:2 [Paraglomus occultum]